MRQTLAITISLPLMLPAQASAEVWSMAGASSALECATLFERFEAAEPGSEPFDFGAAAADVRERVSWVHGAKFAEQVFEGHQSYWDSEAAYSYENVNRLSALLYECRKLAFAWGYLSE